MLNSMRKRRNLLPHVGMTSFWPFVTVFLPRSPVLIALAQFTAAIASVPAFAVSALAVIVTHLPCSP